MGVNGPLILRCDNRLVTKLEPISQDLMHPTSPESGNNRTTNLPAAAAPGCNRRYIMEKKIGKGMEPQENKTSQYPEHEEIIKDELPRQPGEEHEMATEPIYEDLSVKGYDRLKDKVAIITGGDSGIGRAAAIAYAKEGAHLVIVYKDEHEDAEVTRAECEKYGARVLLLAGDIGDPAFSVEIIRQTMDQFGRLDILVNNAAEQHPQDSLLDITDDQLEKTFRTNIFGMFYLTREALPHLKEGASIINTTSITAYRGNKQLIDYSSTKGAIAAFTRALAENLGEQKIRVNQIAPGPIWTPLIPATFSGDGLENFGKGGPLNRPGQPVELAEAYVFLAWDYASSFITGQTIHINGGEIING